MGKLFLSQWFPYLLRGIVAVLVAILIIFWPASTLATLSLLFATLAILDGVALVFTAARSTRDRSQRTLLFVGGVFGATMGLAAAIVPGLSLLAISYLIAGWAIGSGVAEAMAAWNLRTESKSGGLWFFTGLASVVFGVVVALKPAVGLAILLDVVACYALVAGMALITLALRLRAIGSRKTSALDARAPS